MVYYVYASVVELAKLADLGPVAFDGEWCRMRQNRIAIFNSWKEREIVENNYWIEINPLDKENEIMEIFKEYAPKSFSKMDDGYDWLEEDDDKMCVFLNPCGGDDLAIQIEDEGEFTLYFSAWHGHYDSYQGAYEDMIGIIKEIFNNELGIGTIRDAEGNWLGSCFVKKEEAKLDPKTLFDFAFTAKLTPQSGYEVKISFWNPVDNVVATKAPS